MLDRTDDYHDASVKHYRASTTRLIHSLIIPEFHALTLSRRLNRSMAERAIWSLIDDPSIERIWADATLIRAGMTLISERPDKMYSLCDAVSFVVMRDRNITEALTLDHHFEQEGFQRLLTR